MIDDDDITPEERAEAEALARALDRERGGGDLPEDAFEAAALLRYSKDGGELDPSRAEAILQDVLSNARAPERKAASWFERFRWPIFALATGAAAAAVLVTFAGSREIPVAALPEPNAALLRAQVQAAAGGDLAALEEQMASYRVAVVASLEEQYRR